MTLERQEAAARGTPVMGSQTVVPFRPERNATLDILRWAGKRDQIPVLLEVDVTVARQAIRAYHEESGVALSFTAWVVGCVARAAAEHPRIHSLRKGRHRLVLFQDVDVSVLVERAIADGVESLPMPLLIRQADGKSPLEIHREIREAQSTDVERGAASVHARADGRLQALFFRLPAWVRDVVFWRWLFRSPERMKSTMGTVVVSAAGMMTPGILCWGIPSSVHPLAVAVGGIARRGDDSAFTEVLALTIVFDHVVTDGAPVGRFVRRLHELLTRAHGLECIDPGEARRTGASGRPPERRPSDSQT